MPVTGRPPCHRHDRGRRAATASGQSPIAAALPLCAGADRAHPAIGISTPPDGAASELSDGCGGGCPCRAVRNGCRTRVHRLHPRVVWLVVGLAAAAAGILGIIIGINRAFFSGQARQAWSQAWPPRPCVVEGIDAAAAPSPSPRTARSRTVVRSACVCSSFPRPRSRSARTRSRISPAGREDAATEQALDQGWRWSALNLSRDILLVDQRGTGGSNPHGGDVTQYQGHGWRWTTWTRRGRRSATRSST